MRLPVEAEQLESDPQSPHGKVVAMVLAFFLESEAGGHYRVAGQPA